MKAFKEMFTPGLVSRCYEAAAANGWHDLERLGVTAKQHAADAVTYIISEAFEMLSAREKRLRSDFAAFEAAGGTVEAFKKHVKGTEQDEFADIVIRLADLLGFLAAHGLPRPEARAVRFAGAGVRPVEAVAKFVSMDGVFQTGGRRTVWSWLVWWNELFGTFSDSQDLEKHVEAKLAYNATRGALHGKVLA